MVLPTPKLDYFWPYRLYATENWIQLVTLQEIGDKDALNFGQTFFEKPRIEMSLVQNAHHNNTKQTKQTSFFSWNCTFQVQPKVCVLFCELQFTEIFAQFRKQQAFVEITIFIVIANCYTNFFKLDSYLKSLT